jgi:hypothetical protein
MHNPIRLPTVATLSVAQAFSPHPAGTYKSKRQVQRFPFRIRCEPKRVPFLRIEEGGKNQMKKKLAYILAVPMLFFVMGFQGSCRSQCEEVRQELIKDCRDDLGANNERCRIDQMRAQEICRDESYLPPE